MPRAVANKLYRSFVKGLITEAGPLTYPENASIDEDNCVLFQAGNRSRRLGIDFEPGGDLSQFITNVGDYQDIAVTEYVWQAAGNNSSKNFLVMQVARFIYFWDLSYSPTHVGYKPFFVDLNDFAIDGQFTGNTPLNFSSGRGFLFVVGGVTDPFMVQYSSATDSFSTQRIYVQIRDFKGLDDGLANDEEPTSLSAAHKYNLRNQGWLDPAGGAGDSVTYYTPFGGKATYTQAPDTPITTYHTTHSRYPGNNKQWWVAKDSTSGAFDATLLNTFFFGSTRAPRGHYIVEAFNIDRTAVSGVTGLPVEKQSNRPTCTTFVAGRVWYGCDSSVYYSQILDDKSKAGFCYQEADPTSEDINELIATDGGVVTIPEMSKVQRLVAIAGGVMCFASNGIWFISGTQAGFSATDITVTKVSPIGTDAPRSIIHVQDVGGDLILWWSKVGIQALQQRSGQFGPIDNAFDTTILSQTTIQSFYNDIPKGSISNVKAHYDPSTNLVQWLFNDGSLPYRNAFNRILNYDLTLRAFYPWSVATRAGNLGPFIVGIFDPVNATDNRNQFTKYIVASGDASTFFYGFATEHDDNFADWQVVPYTSFVESGYELMDDAMRQKQAMYVYCYFRRTEDAYELNEDGDYELQNPSSCFLQIKWDWSDSQISNRWSQKQQAYRLTRIPMFSEDDLAFDTGFPIVVSRNKVRGHGRAVQFRFENDAIGSNFDLLGWAVPFSGNTQP